MVNYICVILDSLFHVVLTRGISLHPRSGSLLSHFMGEEIGSQHQPVERSREWLSPQVLWAMAILKRLLLVSHGVPQVPTVVDHDSWISVLWWLRWPLRDVHPGWIFSWHSFCICSVLLGDKLPGCQLNEQVSASNASFQTNLRGLLAKSASFSL